MYFQRGVILPRKEAAVNYSCSSVYHPTFSATYRGKTYHYKFKFPTLEEPQIGDRAYFYINPKDPTEYIDSTDMTEYGEMGVILFGFCIFGLWLNRWITKKGKNNES